MSTVVEVLLTVLRTVVLWIKDAFKEQAQRQLESKTEQVRKMEDAAAEERRRRLLELDEKAAAVRSRHDADELLKSVTGTDDTLN